jgi:hypothetical protein
VAVEREDSRTRARRARLAAARERRRKLDPEQVAREARMDEAAVDLELAWEQRGRAAEALLRAEVATGAAIDRLVAEGVSIGDIRLMTGLTSVELRRLRRLFADRSAAEPRA